MVAAGAVGSNASVAASKVHLSSSRWSLPPITRRPSWATRFGSRDPWRRSSGYRLGAGIALLYLLGPQLWPAVVLGDLLVNNYSAVPIGSAIGQTFGNLLEVLGAALLLRRFARAALRWDPWTVSSTCSSRSSPRPR